MCSRPENAPSRTAEGVAAEVVQARRHDEQRQVRVARQGAERHDGEAGLEREQLRPVVRAALWEDADGTALAQPLVHLPNASAKGWG